MKLLKIKKKEILVLPDEPIIIERKSQNNPTAPSVQGFESHEEYVEEPEPSVPSVKEKNSTIKPNQKYKRTPKKTTTSKKKMNGTKDFQKYQRKIRRKEKS